MKTSEAIQAEQKRMAEDLARGMQNIFPTVSRMEQKRDEDDAETTRRFEDAWSDFENPKRNDYVARYRKMIVEYFRQIHAMLETCLEDRGAANAEDKASDVIRTAVEEILDARELP